MSLNLKEIEDSPHILDTLLQIEDLLDSSDIYVYRNWIKGEIVEGPFIRRYWVTLSLLFPYDEMPDPRAALRLHKLKIKVDFKKVHKHPAKPETGSPNEPNDETSPGPTFWFVTITVPKRLLDQMEAIDAEIYDDEIEINDVQDALDAGLNDESAFTGGDGGANENPFSEEMEAPNTSGEIPNV